MRTTVTLDEDLAQALKRQAREREIPFRQALNDAIRAGLRPHGTATKRYRMEPRWLGVRAGVDLTKALTIAGELEDQQTLRKLEQGR